MMKWCLGIIGLASFLSVSRLSVLELKLHGLEAVETKSPQAGVQLMALRRSPDG